MSLQAQLEPGDHVVHFYGDDADLIAGAADHLSGAIARGGVAVLVATPEHLQEFERVFAGSGIDVGAARRAGQLIEIDAATALTGFMISGGVDPVRFDAVIGSVMRAAAQHGRPVTAFGEMVGLLWEGGTIDAALEIESLWDRLAVQIDFALYCAYRTPGAEATAAHHHEDLRRICHAHTAVTGAHDAVHAQRFAPSATSPRAARVFVRDVLAGWDLADLVDDVAVVVGELATNALIHARSPFVVAVTRHNRTLRVAVRDGSPAPPTPTAVTDLSTSGRGWALIGALSVSHGHDRLEGGKLVWADFEVPR